MALPQRDHVNHVHDIICEHEGERFYHPGIDEDILVELKGAKSWHARGQDYIQGIAKPVHANQTYNDELVVKTEDVLEIIGREDLIDGLREPHDGAHTGTV